eukprot:gb/GFBE01007854.1/.p1 GENE.gb/GFBE01007854.1/~~gb/GFBE01007854.1/.p1  ORF type:complete len:189 (+),score=31.25 gb/GFBE01007854.1/:1-567(+)
MVIQNGHRRLLPALLLPLFLALASTRGHRQVPVRRACFAVPSTSDAGCSKHCWRYCTRRSIAQQARPSGRDVQEPQAEEANEGTPTGSFSELSLQLWESLVQLMARPIIATPATLSGALIILGLSFQLGAAAAQQMVESSRSTRSLPVLSLRSELLTKQHQQQLGIPDDKMFDMEVAALEILQDARTQ